MAAERGCSNRLHRSTERRPSTAPPETDSPETDPTPDAKSSRRRIVRNPNFDPLVAAPHRVESEPLASRLWPMHGETGRDSSLAKLNLRALPERRRQDAGSAASQRWQPCGDGA